MNNNLEFKKNKVNDFVNILKGANSFLFFIYHGLCAKAISNLRRELYNHGSKLYVCKNNIFNRAINICNFKDIPEIKGASALIISHEDEVSPFKCLYNTILENEKIKYICGILNSKYIDDKTFMIVAKLQNKNNLLSMFLSCLQNPIAKFACSLKAIADTKRT
jgi:large subunit ribosomal protein L10